MTARRTLTDWLPVAVWLAVIGWASLSPGAGLRHGLDLLAHAGAYVVLAWLLRRALGGRGAVAWIAPAALATMVGLAFELLQAALPYRSAEARDVAADAFGAVVGAIAPGVRR